MKVLAGALVGLVLGAAIVAGLTVAGVAKNYWPILVVAVVAGMAMGRIAAASRAKYLKGGLAALATAVAMIVGQMGAAQILSKQSVEIGPSTVTAGTPAADAGEAETDAAEVTEDIIETPEVILPVSSPPPTGGMAGGATDVSPMDIGFFAVGCLIAYQLGKGSDAAPATEEAAEASEGEAAADAGDAEPTDESEKD
ncbi:MAG: hypothetical protein AAF266_04190 [Planctomycetota bacterium]